MHLFGVALDTSFYGIRARPLWEWVNISEAMNHHGALRTQRRKYLWVLKGTLIL
jgi:hypothetical protein